MFGPMGDGAHIQVHSQIRAALSGTVPTPGSVAAWAKSVSLKAACTLLAATGTPTAPKPAASSGLKVTSRLTLQGLPALPLAPSARDPPGLRAAAADRPGPAGPAPRRAGCEAARVRSRHEGRGATGAAERVSRGCGSPAGCSRIGCDGPVRLSSGLIIIWDN